MRRFEVISFDAEGTLVTPDFSQAIWHEAIPALYAQKNGIDIAQARMDIVEKYDQIGDQRLEWYDIEYWFRYLDLGSSEAAIRSCLNRIACYPEVTEVLSSLTSEYTLIVASGTPLELLHFLLQDIRTHFAHVFSSTSHFKQLKSPDFYLNICEELGIKPSQVVHVGDNWQFDFLNSQQAGIYAFYLDRSGRNHRESLGDLTQLKHFLLPSK
jgi:HAD superfamily hydrolase (TIGR01549 family)